MREFGKRSGQGKQELSCAIDFQGSIELVGEFDGGTGVAESRGRKLDSFAAESDGVIGGDGSLISEAEAACEIEATGQSAEVVFGLSWGDGESLVKVGKEAFEHGVGLLAGRGLGETQFADETILEGSPEAFDASLGLRRTSRDLLDSEFVEGASDLGWELLSGEFFGHRPVGIVALEDAVAVAVKAEGHAVTVDELMKQAEVSDGVLGFWLKVGGHDAAGGVVLQAEQGEARAASLEPVVTAGIGEEHEAEGGAALAACAINTGPPLLRRGEMGAAKEAAQGLAAEGEALVFDEFLMEVGVVESSITGARQFEHLLAYLIGQCPGLRASGVAVQQPSNGVGLIAAHQALHLASAALQ